MSGDKLWELSRPDWHCPACWANAAEIQDEGHRRVPDGLGWGGTKPCPQACTCIPEHRSLAEHRMEMAAQDLAVALK